MLFCVILWLVWSILGFLRTYVINWHGFVAVHRCIEQSMVFSLHIFHHYFYKALSVYCSNFVVVTLLFNAALCCVTWVVWIPTYSKPIPTIQCENDLADTLCWYHSYPLLWLNNLTSLFVWITTTDLLENITDYCAILFKLCDGKLLVTNLHPCPCILTFLIQWLLNICISQKWC